MTMTTSDSSSSDDNGNDDRQSIVVRGTSSKAVCVYSEGAKCVYCGRSITDPDDVSGVPPMKTGRGGFQGREVKKVWSCWYCQRVKDLKWKGSMDEECINEEELFGQQRKAVVDIVATNESLGKPFRISAKMIPDVSVKETVT